MKTTFIQAVFCLQEKPCLPNIGNCKENSAMVWCPVCITSTSHGFLIIHASCSSRLCANPQTCDHSSARKIGGHACSHQFQLALRCSRKFLGHNNLQLCRSNAASEHDLFFLAQMHMLLQHTLCACTHDEGSSSLTYIILHNGSYFALSICKTPC